MDAPTRIGSELCQSGSADQPLEPKEASAMKIAIIGIDLAKCMFQVDGVDERGKTFLRKQLQPSQVVEFMAQLPP